jgi:hypothetical protein
MMAAISLLSCRSPVQMARGKSIEPLSGAASVSLPGPSTLRPDGSVRHQPMNRPDGHLLKTLSAKSLRRHQVNVWARNQACIAARSRGLELDAVVGWIEIDDPRILIIDENTQTDVYDVSLEVWHRAIIPVPRERRVN